jgi:hypothetical protein
LRQEVGVAIFDATDINYLVLNLSPTQIHDELHHADVAASVAVAYAERDEELFWRDYISALELVRHIQQRGQPRFAKYVSKNKIEKANIDMPQFVGNYVKLRKSGKFYVGLCPFHNDHHPSFVVYAHKAKCFGCGWCGDAIQFCMDYLNMDFKRAIEYLLK